MIGAFVSDFVLHWESWMDKEERLWWEYMTGIAEEWSWSSSHNLSKSKAVKSLDELTVVFVAVKSLILILVSKVDDCLFPVSAIPSIPLTTHWGCCWTLDGLVTQWIVKTFIVTSIVQHIIQRYPRCFPSRIDALRALAKDATRHTVEAIKLRFVKS